MKAVLVIDMPKDCWDCHLVSEFHSCRGTVLKNDFDFKDITNFDKGERPSWCPLRPLPQIIEYEMTDTQTAKAVELIDNAFKLGWNTCLNAITGETE